MVVCRPAGPLTPPEHRLYVEAGAAAVAPTRCAVGLCSSFALLVFVSSVRAQGAMPAARVVRGTLSFDGHSTLGDFVGTTDSVRGDMIGGPDLAAVRGWVEAPVATLHTGNGRRDRDLRKSMEVDTFPTMRFDLASVVPGEALGDSVAVTLQGRLTIHGVARDVEVPARVWLAAERIRLRSDFPLDLREYRIGGLSKMLGVLKMHEHIEVHVELVFAPADAP